MNPGKHGYEPSGLSGLQNLCSYVAAKGPFTKVVPPGHGQSGISKPLWF